MKALTKRQIKKLIQENIDTGMNHLEAMAALQNEFEMYSMKIMEVTTEMMILDAGL